MFALALCLTIIGGIAAGVQAPTNATLGQSIGALQATFVSFFGGTLILGVIVIFMGGEGLSGIAHVPWWQLIGGCYGAFMVVIINLGGPILGFALFTTIFTLGQLVCGVLVDAFGWFATDAIPINSLRIIGCLVMLVGILLIYKGTGAQVSSGTKAQPKSKIILAVCLAIIAGAAAGAQAPTNAALGIAIGKVQASFINFSVGALSTLVALFILGKGRVSFKRKSDAKISWWMVLGGFWGAIGVNTNIFSTPILGVTLQMVTFMAGQLTCGAVVDSMGLLRAKKVTINKWRLAGILVIAVGVVLIAIGKAL